MKKTKLQLILIVSSLCTLLFLGISGYIISKDPNTQASTLPTPMPEIAIATPTPDLVFLNETTEPYPDQMMQTVFTKVNELRESLGLKPLIRNKLLDESACAKVDDEILNNYYAHISPEGLKPDYFIHAQAIKTVILGENLDKSNMPEELTSPYDDWRNSIEHYQNLVNPLYTDEGLCFKTDLKGYMLGAEHFIKL